MQLEDFLLLGACCGAPTFLVLAIGAIIVLTRRDAQAPQRLAAQLGLPPLDARNRAFGGNYQGNAFAISRGILSSGSFGGESGSSFSVAINVKMAVNTAAMPGLTIHSYKRRMPPAPQVSFEEVFPTRQGYELLSAQAREVLIAFMRKWNRVSLEDQPDPQRRNLLPEARVRLETTIPASSTAEDLRGVLDDLQAVARAIEATR